MIGTSNFTMNDGDILSPDECVVKVSALLRSVNTEFVEKTRHLVEDNFNKFFNYCDPNIFLVWSNNVSWRIG